MPTWAKILLAVLIAALVGMLALLLFGGDDDVSLTADEPEVVSAAQLSELAGEAAMPVYWLGERDGAEYEVTETGSGRIYVRYLQGDAEAGDELLTVGTYPSKDGVAELRRAVGNRDGAELGRTDDGAVLLIDPSSPNNAHLAYRGDDFQIEVFSPVPGQALRLASRGAVLPVP